MKTAIAVCFSVLPRSICCNHDITHKTSHLEPKYNLHLRNIKINLHIFA